MKTYNHDEFKSYLLKVLQEQELEEISIEVDDGFLPLWYFIKYENICDVKMYVYGGFGGIAELVNLVEIDKQTIDSYVDKIIEMFEGNGNTTYKVKEVIE